MVIDTAIVAILFAFGPKHRWFLTVYSYSWLLATVLFLFGAGLSLGIPTLTPIEK